MPESTDHHIATMLLLNIPEIESADAVKSLERFARLIRSEEEFAEKFVSASPGEALQIIYKDAPQEITGQFKAFIDRHGHRCVREAELREQPWEENPGQLIQYLQTQVRTGEVRHVTHDVNAGIREALKHLPRFKRAMLKSIIPTARKAVARREITKGLSIKMVDTVRKGYQAFAVRLGEAGLLDDRDQGYFLTHEELGQLITDRSPSWKAIAGRRREILPELDKLVFEEVCFGIPEPLENETEIEISANQLKGTPVSGGKVRAKVRIVKSLADASRLEKGEIMVASFTDIGWTPYFSIISGLITEIGSPLSHGAVVAREYGIPAVVAAKGAIRWLSNGNVVQLDGDRGIIELIQSSKGKAQSF